MTAINIIADDRAAYMVTDSASYDFEAVVQGWNTKAKVFPRIGLAFAASGFVVNANRLKDLVERFADYESAIEAFPDLLYSFYHGPHFHRDDRDPDQDQMDVFVTGWSKRKGIAEAFKISTHAAHGVQAFEMFPATIASSMPASRSMLANAGMLTNDGRPDWRTDPVNFLTKLIQIQRQHEWPLPNTTRKGFCVGGSAELTVIDATGISQRTLIRWPDEIGEMIDPSAAPVQVSEPTTSNVDFSGLSRLQRERMRRKVEKGTFRPRAAS